MCFSYKIFYSNMSWEKILKYLFKIYFYMFITFKRHDYCSRRCRRCHTNTFICENVASYVWKEKKNVCMYASFMIASFYIYINMIWSCILWQYFSNKMQKTTIICHLIEIFFSERKLGKTSVNKCHLNFYVWLYYWCVGI